MKGINKQAKDTTQSNLLIKLRHIYQLHQVSHFNFNHRAELQFQRNFNFFGENLKD